MIKKSMGYTGRVWQRAIRSKVKEWYFHHEEEI